MPPHGPDISGIAAVTVCAVLAGLAFRRLRQPAIVGYILSGLLMGQGGIGLIERSESVIFLAELGVIMLLFVLGTEISLKAFAMVLRSSVITTSGQIVFAMTVSSLMAVILGWDFEMALLMGFILAISSTAVSVSMLEDINELRTPIGQTVIGVMIVQDLTVVPMIIIASSLGASAASGMNLSVLFKVMGSVTLLLLCIRYFASRGKIVLPFTELLSADTSLLALSMLAFCLVAAAISSALGLSPAYGAFLSGLIIAGSTLRSDVIRVVKPIQSILTVVFFVSIGLLIDIDFIADNFLLVSTITVGGLAFKSLLNVSLLKLQGKSYEKALPAGLIMAQVGEFSFILAGIGLANGVLEDSGYQLAVSMIALSLLLSPLWMATVRKISEARLSDPLSFREVLLQVFGQRKSHISRKIRYIRILYKIIMRRLRNSKVQKFGKHPKS
jgi:CPA2 family monovalent cation:H+ antiporter-2